MYEVELKARITDLEPAVNAALRDIAQQLPREEIYEDLYLDDDAQSLATSHRELRIRSITTLATASKKVVLTYKDPPFDRSTDSKPEYEVVVAESRILADILHSLGYDVRISFTKRCANFDLVYHGFNVLVTIVKVPELDDTFVEIEAPVALLDNTDDAKSALFSLLDALHVPSTALTTDAYVDMVRRARRKS